MKSLFNQPWKVLLAWTLVTVAIATYTFVFKPNPRTDTSAFKGSSTELGEITWDMLAEFDHASGKGPKELLDLDGKRVRVPGFIVPLNDFMGVLNEFLLVPNAQACIHVPPPPPNLIIHVKLKKPIAIEQVSNPSWVMGDFKIETTTSVHGPSSYTILADSLVEYE